MREHMPAVQAGKPELRQPLGEDQACCQPRNEFGEVHAGNLPVGQPDRKPTRAWRSTKASSPSIRLDFAVPPEALLFVLVLVVVLDLPVLDYEDELPEIVP